MRASIPGTSQSGLLCRRSQAQTEKHPAISPSAARRYQSNVVTIDLPSGPVSLPEERIQRSGADVKRR